MIHPLLPRKSVIKLLERVVLPQSQLKRLTQRLKQVYLQIPSKLIRASLQLNLKKRQKLSLLKRRQLKPRRNQMQCPRILILLLSKRKMQRKRLLMLKSSLTPSRPKSKLPRKLQKIQQNQSIPPNQAVRLTQKLTLQN